MNASAAVTDRKCKNTKKIAAPCRQCFFWVFFNGLFAFVLQPQYHAVMQHQQHAKESRAAINHSSFKHADTKKNA